MGRSLDWDRYENEIWDGIEVDWDEWPCGFIIAAWIASCVLAVGLWIGVGIMVWKLIQ